MSVSPQRPRPLPLCRSVRAAALHPRKKPQRPGLRAAIRCAIPRTYRWAGAATPTQRSTTQALDRASDVINAGNVTSNNKFPWRSVPPGPAAPATGAPAGTASGRRSAGGRAARIPAFLSVLLGWLAAILRRAGDRLFAMNDAEAGWRGWQTTRTHGGLGRRYRDPQFGTLGRPS